MRPALYITTVVLCVLGVALWSRRGEQIGVRASRVGGKDVGAHGGMPANNSADVAKGDAPTITRTEGRGGAPAQGNERSSASVAVRQPRPEHDKCSPSIRTIVARGAGTSLRERLEAIDALPSALGPVDRYALYMFLLDSKRVDDLTSDQERVLVNDIMKLLRRQSDGSPEMWAVLAQVYRDKTQDMVVRDYAIQHMGSWFENYTSNKEVENVLWEAARSPEGTISGAAMLSLSRVARLNPEVKRDRLGQAAIDMASNEKASIAARATSIAVAAQFSGDEVLPLARRLALESNSIALRSAAIGVIGDRGTVADIALLQRLAESGDTNCMDSLEFAIKKLNNT